MPSDIEKLANELLKDPLKVSVTPPATTVERINQRVMFVEAGRKRGLLTELFADPNFTRVLVFTRTKRGADKVARMLEGGGVASAAIHGNKSQGQREKSLAAFKDGKVRALVATDIAARGIDISSVTHVVQYELPDVPEQYVHRIGRTARAGKDGSAVAFCAEDERSLLRDIERVTRQKIPSKDRRNDAALAQLSANANEDVKAGDRAETRGRPQQRRGNNQPRRQEPRRQESGEQAREGNRGGQNRRRGNGGGANANASGGQPQRNAAKSNGNGNANANNAGGNRNQQKPQQPKAHRKGPNPHKPQQGNPRSDVMNVNAGRSNASGPSPSASHLMRLLASQK